MSAAGVVLGYLGLALWLFAVLGKGVSALCAAIKRPGKYRGRPLI